MSATIEITQTANTLQPVIAVEIATIGPAGEPGPTGATGPAGPANVLSVGAVSSGATPAVVITGTSPAQVLNFTLAKGDEGDSAYEVALASGFVGTQAQWLASLVGPQGVQGIQGIQGIQGATGATGATGAKGDKGDPGETGAQGSAGTAATISVGTVTTGEPNTPVVITNTGTSMAAVFDFSIPKGVPGEGSVQSVAGTGSVNGITLTGTVTESGSLTLGGALSGVSLTTQVSGTLPIANGGTNATTASGARTSLGLGSAAVLTAGAALGAATLDAGGTVPLSQIPASIQGGLNYQGAWNASTNTPTLTSSAGTKGHYYAVSVAGSTSLNGITDWNIGDLAVYNGTAWEQIDNTDSVTSVNGFTGTVVLDAEDVGAYPDTNPSGFTTNTGTVTSVAATAGTGISVSGSPITSSGTLTITNTAPDQTVVLTAGTGISTSGTYPNFTITNASPSLGGDVVGAASSTDNAIARYDGTTGKIIQNSAVTIADDGATVIAANSTTNGLRITQIGTGNALLVEDSANPDATPFVINSGGQVFVGATQAYATTVGGINYNPLMQMHAANANTPSVGYEVANWATTTGAGSFSFAKSRGGVIGTHAVVNSGDSVGETYYFGSDGTNFIEAARISAQVDGTPGTNDMPGRLLFLTTADGASTPTERMRIDNLGRIAQGSIDSRAMHNISQNTTSLTGIDYYRTGGTLPSTATAYSIQYHAETTTPSGAATFAEVTGFKHQPSTTGANSVISNMFGFAATGAVLGAGASITNQYGHLVDATFTTATNNYGFFSNIASGTGRFNFYAAGTAANVFAGTTSIGGAVGAESLRVTPVASAVNYFNMYGAAAGGAPTIYADGSSASLDFNVSPKGASGAFNIFGNGSLQFRVSPTASAVNYLQVTGSATGGFPTLSVQGSDTNITAQYSSKGTGGHVFASSGGTQFIVGNTASAVNSLLATGGATGNATTLFAFGSDTNIDIALTPKGTGVLRFGTYTAGILAQAGYITIKDAAGNTRNLLVG